MVVDPVCGMTLDPAMAAVSADFQGARLYFCSEACHRRFLASPESYAQRAPSPLAVGEAACAIAGPSPSQRIGPDVVRSAALIGLAAGALLLGFYLTVLTLVSGWSFAGDQFGQYWPFILALSVGFGIQVGLFTHLRRLVHGAASTKIVAATGTTSGIAMVSCCAHYLANLLPVLGATGLIGLVDRYQVELFWFGIASNLAGILYIGRRIISFMHGAET